jgi:hypothetical protein
MNLIADPTAEIVNIYLQKWQTLKKYTLQEESLSLLFQKLCPKNDDILHILLKVSALNDFYSTNIFDTHSVARHILSKSPASRLAAGDCSLVNDLANVTIGGKPRHLYSFASKYCNHHNPEAFPIYDSYVQKMLMHFRNRDAFIAFDVTEMKEYERFVEIIKAFQQHYSLDQFTLRQIDIYLWLAGKEAFPAKKKKKIPPSLVQ